MGAEDFHDELPGHIAESMTDPEFALAWRASPAECTRVTREKCRHCGEAVGLYAPGRWLHRPDEAAGRRTPYGLCRTATYASV